MAKGGSSVALAFICTKALLPIRVPLTLALTPAVARCGCICALPLSCRERACAANLCNPCIGHEAMTWSLCLPHCVFAVYMLEGLAGV